MCAVCAVCAKARRNPRSRLPSKQNQTLCLKLLFPHPCGRLTPAEMPARFARTRTPRMPGCARGKTVSPAAVSAAPTTPAKAARGAVRCGARGAVRAVRCGTRGARGAPRGVRCARCAPAGCDLQGGTLWGSPTFFCLAMLCGTEKVGAGPAQRAGERKTLHSHGTTFSFPRPGRRLTVDQLSCSHDLGVVFPGCGSFPHDLGAVFPGCGAFRQAFHFEPDIARAAGRTGNGRESGTIPVQGLPLSLRQDQAGGRFSWCGCQLYSVQQCGARKHLRHDPHF